MYTEILNKLKMKYECNENELDSIRKTTSVDPRGLNLLEKEIYFNKTKRALVLRGMQDSLKFSFNLILGEMNRDVKFTALVLEDFNGNMAKIINGFVKESNLNGYIANSYVDDVTIGDSIICGQYKVRYEEVSLIENITIENYIIRGN